MNPKQFDKIKPIRGDVSVDSLGISAEDEQTLASNVTVVFHCAANVRFDQPLKEAVNLNTLGTKRVITLAEKMPNLKVFVHVSTAYCQCNEEVLEERAYKAPHNPLGIATMSQLLDNEILDALTPRQALIDSIENLLFIQGYFTICSLLKGLPNTYAYTKALTEDLVDSYSGKIPIVIARPSIGN